MRPYASALDVGVLFNISAAAPLGTLEMLVMGLPIAVSNLGGAAEMVLTGETASPFPAGESLADFLQTMSAPFKRETVGRAADREFRRRPQVLQL